MKRRIIKYIEYMQERSDSDKIDENVILNKLSFSLRSELIVEIKGRIIKIFHFFHPIILLENLHLKLLSLLVRKSHYPKKI